MPCDSIITNSVNMPAMQTDILRAALTELGAKFITASGDALEFQFDGVFCTLRNGKLTTRRSAYQQGRQQDGAIADAVKRAYSHQVVRLKARANGWKIQQTGTHKYKVTR